MSLVRMVINTATAAAGKLLRLSGSGRTGESFTGLVGPQQFGLNSCPPEGAVAVVCLEKNGALVISTDDARYRIEVLPGEARLHNDEGDHVHIKKGGVIEVKSSEKILADTKDLVATCSGKLEANVTGNMTANVGGDATVTADGKLKGTGKQGVELDGKDGGTLCGVATTGQICQFTGLAHPGSTTVKASKE